MTIPNFSDSAKNVITTGSAEAKELHHAYIGTEHLLLGLLLLTEKVVPPTDDGTDNGSGKNTNSLDDNFLETPADKDSNIPFGNDSNFDSSGKNSKDSLSKFQKLLIDNKITYKKSKEAIISFAGTGKSDGQWVGKFSPRVRKIFEHSHKANNERHKKYVEIDDLFLTILQEGDGMAVQTLEHFGFDIQNAIDILEPPAKGPIDALLRRTGRDNRVKSILNKYGVNLTNLAKSEKLDPVFDRDLEIDRMVQILAKRNKNNPVLIGDPGVGKTAIVEGLAQKIVAGDVPDFLIDKQIYSVSIAELVSGTRYRGDFEERLTQLSKEVEKRPEVIIFFDEIHTMVGAGEAEGQSLDAANILKPMLTKPDFRLIGSTTEKEYRRFIETDSALERRFQKVMIKEPTIPQAIKIMQGLRSKYEKYHEVTLLDEALIASVELSDRYLSDRFLPDKAIDLLDEASARAKVKFHKTPASLLEAQKAMENYLQMEKTYQSKENYSALATLKEGYKELKDTLTKEQNDWDKARSNTPSVTEEMIAEVISMQTGIPAMKISETENKKLRKISEILHESIIGQNEAIEAVGNAIKRSRAGLKDPDRPIASFIFAGPTGVGKTELAKTLAKYLFDNPKNLVRIDMSEYAEKFNVSKLIGTTPGFVGYHEGGELTNAIRKHPHSVILFDEIEKAHPDIFNTLLQLLDDGRLTDGQGRVVDFKNTIIIMTTNLGSKKITQEQNTGFAISDDVDLGYTKMKDLVNSQLKEHFRPEFLNRIDDLIIFERLRPEGIKQITVLLLNELKTRMQKKNFELKYSDEVVDYISKIGYDKNLGARPLRRAIQSKIEDQISDMIIEQDLLEYSEIEINVKGDNPENQSLDFKINSLSNPKQN